ncbi:urea carboxylase-associated family protein [Variovorax sp. ZS18.2.2]|uniref:urea amidolyase associated protein UAAP2 n=1 Tax=Variovorax sp. ZS18.2.2 TaxID=2971255 RepID=UPI002151D984|nr:urea amidolyase associated protein UAAP2 [Variovorax sp. ZS18.2.2]MCR6475982.1 urea carboxylase-associated family protein [Variovorax sp. ZS18.2.2]
MTTTVSTPSSAQRLQESALDPARAVLRHRQPAGEPWLGEIRAGQTVRIVDLEGNQAADVLFYNRHDVAEHYSASDTLLRQSGIYLTTGSVLVSSEGRPMLTVVADTCGRHDTLGGACAAESNTVRYALQKKFMHSCRDNFLTALIHADIGLGKRDLVPNINFFMNVPVTPEGGLRFDDGVSGPGKYVELRAEMDVWMLVSNCPQLNNPCNAYNPTPVEFIVWDDPVTVD